ncbi:hypothetical protein [Natronolimnobius baerhuensis]|uniref:DUF8048 domain-containing protein n=1 Tax=Natronolimnobius baerhuensis TaxID=253108 RepID=A0A202E6A3_9EURY|nr:hypothetical protein [Natronolimnobius baerhuensis]OVE83775.1 hypothetical protein B2G88_15250 [Natronolimnobius baerhuensis]
MTDGPISGQILLLAAAKTSVTPARLSTLVVRTQAALERDRERYRREFECVYIDESGSYEAFLVDWGHWDELGEMLGLERREHSAIRRAHEEQLLRAGRRADREDEFETALEIREPVLIGVASD